MSIYNTIMKKEVSREEALKLFISAVQAAPGIFPQNLSKEDFITYLWEGAEKLISFVELGKID